jgi:hypothetical protein
MHSVRVVAEALEDGRWPVEVDVLDALAQLVNAARDVLVDELAVTR